MRVLYLSISIIFLILSMLPPIMIQFSYESYVLTTFGQKGLVGLLLPLLYGLISLVFAWLSKSQHRKLIYIFFAIFLVINVILVFIGMFGFREP